MPQPADPPEGKITNQMSAPRRVFRFNQRPCTIPHCFKFSFWGGVPVSLGYYSDDDNVIQAEVCSPPLGSTPFCHTYYSSSKRPPATAICLDSLTANRPCAVQCGRAPEFIVNGTAVYESGGGGKYLYFGKRVYVQMYLITFFSDDISTYFYALNKQNYNQFLMCFCLIIHVSSCFVCVFFFVRIRFKIIFFQISTNQLVTMSENVALSK